MLVKKHIAPDKRLLLAICDNDLKDKEFEDDNGVCLNLKTDFYNGEQMEEEKVKDLIQTADMLNVIGEKSIKLIKNLGLAHEEDTKEICGIPYLMITLK